jgi:predicted DNA-binding transcriptional regulator AlpA
LRRFDVAACIGRRRFFSHRNGKEKTFMHALPESGFIRLKDIIGDPKADPPSPAIIPVSKSTWYQGVRDGRYPQPTRALGARITAWSCESIRELIKRSSVEVAANDELPACSTAIISGNESWKQKLRTRSGAKS